MVAIFRKDARHLWPQVVGFLLLVGLYCWSDTTLPHRLYDERAHTAGVLLMLALWYMVAAVIHQERPASRAQDWLTRPIAWQSIVAAKAVFVLAFLMLPILLSQIVALAANGFSPWRYLPELLWKQALLLALVILPPAALAAVTNGLVQFVLAAIVVIGFFTWDSLSMLSGHWGWGRVEWLHYVGVAAVLLPGLGGLVLFEYARRRTGAARAIVAALVVIYWSFGWLPVPHEALAMGSTPKTGVSLEFDGTRKPLGRGGAGLASMLHQNIVEVMIPIRIGGLPDGAWPLSGGTQISIAGWSSPWHADMGLAITKGPYWASFAIAQPVFDRIKNQPVHARGRVDMTLLSRTSVTNVQAGARGARVDGVGLCTINQASFVQCFAPLESSYWTIRGFEGTSENLSRAMHGCCGVGPGFSAWAVSTGLDPDGPIEAYAPVAHFERELEIPSIVLEGYEVARRR
jgi:hypothetical protein